MFSKAKYLPNKEHFSVLMSVHLNISNLNKSCSFFFFPATEENITQFGSAYQSLRKCHFKGIAQAMQLEKDSAVLVLQPEHAQIYLTYPIWSKRLWKVKNPSAAS